MNKQLTREEFYALEGMIDKTSLRNVLGNLGTICSEKAAHISENWQDNALARMWDKAAVEVERCAEKTAIRNLP